LDKFIDNMPNAEYHRPENGFSSSNVKDFIEDPALIMWDQAAPTDESKLGAVDFGTDFHSYFLQPERFKEWYRVLPEFNRRKKAEKEEELALIEQWRSDGITPVTFEDMEKLEAMRQSALAHPTIDAIMGLNGVDERSYFWQDKCSGVECKCRPDWLVEGLTNKTRLPFILEDRETLVMDVKTIGRFDQVRNEIENLKYYVQDAFYTRGIEQVTDTKVCFVFAFVSTTISLGRYPVRVVGLSPEARDDGDMMINTALYDYKQLDLNNEYDWQTIQLMDRPHWARKQAEYLDNYDELMA